MRFCPLVLVLVVAGAGCTPSAPGPRAPRVPRTAEAPDRLAPPWTVRDAEMRRTQRLHISSVLTSQVDSLVRVDTLESTLELAWSSVPETQPKRYAGMIGAFGVRMAGDTAWRVPAGVTLPFSFVASHESDGAIPTITTPDAASCGAGNNIAVHGWRDLWTELPRTLRPGDTWQDSSRYAICRDSIPLDVTTLRQFEVVGAHTRGEQQVVSVRRTSRSSLLGRGTQFGEPVELRGQGEGTMLLEVSLAGGVVIAGEGTSELRMTLEGRRRFQRIVQESRLLIDAP